VIKALRPAWAMGVGRLGGGPAGKSGRRADDCYDWAQQATTSWRWRNPRDKKK
jgi:hypothetical protein